MKTNIATAALIGALIVTPIPIHADDPPPHGGNSWAALCIVAFAGVAVGAVYIISKRCEPKYYWLMDDNVPPTFWVGTATAKQCKIEGWRRIGGPYNRQQDAPAEHPNPTNTVPNLVSLPMKVVVQSSQDGQQWTPVDEQVVDLEDHVYYPTNTGMFRLEVGAP